MREKALEKAVDDYFREQMPDEIKRLISQAKHDLYYGPLPPGEEGWPGFVRATKVLSRWWDGVREDLVYDTQSETLLTKRDFDTFVREEERAGFPVMLEDYYGVASNAAGKIVFGGELWSHIR